MAELTRDFLINLQTRGGDQSSREFDKVSKSADGATKSITAVGQASYNSEKRIKMSIAERVRQTQLYQAANQALGGQLDAAYEKSQSLRESLKSVANIRFATLAGSIGYVAYQLKSINSAGENVNKQLDSMGIKLTSVVKQAKGLSSYGEAKAASQEYIDRARNFAVKTPFQQTEVLDAMATLAPVFKGDIKKIDTSMRAAAVLAQTKPEQGFQGATYAIREAASGDIRSLAARFDMSPSLIKRYMTSNSDIGSAILAALKESGQTEEMLDQFTNTIEGMQSNIEDAKDYAAGIYNEPIFNAKKNGMMTRMKNLQRLTAPDRGYVNGLRTLGSAQGVIGNAFNIGMANIARPAQAWREGVLASLSPGFARASGALRETDLKVQIKDLQDRGRYNQLDESEIARLKELQRQLRALPAEVNKLENAANEQIRESGTYLARVLGLNTVQKNQLIEQMQETAKKFTRMVEDMKKKFTAGDVYKMITQIQQGLQKTLRNIIAIPTEFYKELKRTGALKFLMDSFKDIGNALGGVLSEIFGQGKESLNQANGIIEGGKKLADLLVMAINASRPFIWIIKNIIVDTLALIKAGVKIVGNTVNSVLGMISYGLRLVGKTQEADKLDKQIAESRNEMEASNVNGAKSGKMGRWDTGNQGQATQEGGNKSWWQRTKENYHGGIIAPILGTAGGGTALTAVSAIMTGLFGIGAVKNIKEIFGGASSEAGGGFKGMLRGVGKLGSGAMDMMPGGNMGIKEMFKLKTLASGRGLGSSGLAVLLNMFLPGPIAQVYSVWVGFRGFLDMVGAVGKGLRGYMNMVKKGGGEVMERAGGIKGIFRSILDSPRKFYEAAKGSVQSDIKFFTQLRESFSVGGGVRDFISKFMKGTASSDTKFFSQVIERIKSIFAPLAKLGGVFKSIGSSVAKFVTGAKGVFSGMGTRLSALFAGLTKLPVVGKFFSGVAKFLGVASPVGDAIIAGKTGWDIGRWFGKQRTRNSSMTVDENVQGKLLGLASRSKVFAKILGVSQEDANAALGELNSRVDAQDAAEAKNKNKPKSDMPIGKRHSGGYIHKSGKYELQSGEYILPAGGFDFQKYARKNEDLSNPIKQSGMSLAKEIGVIMTDNAVLSASLRYFDAVLRLLGINPRNLPAGVMNTMAAAGAQAAQGGAAGNNAGSTSPSNSQNASGAAGPKLTGKRKDDFMSVMEAARKAGDPHPEVVAAQWALESGWGKSQSGKNNYFGIKAKSGQAGTMVSTHEQGKNGMYSTQARFADYNSLGDGVAARVQMMKDNPRWANAGYGAAGTSTEALQALKRGGYATDGAYVSKLQTVLRSAGIDPDAVSTTTPAVLRGGSNQQGAANSGGSGGHSIHLGDININTSKGETKEQLDNRVAQQQATQRRKALAELGRTTRNN